MAESIESLEKCRGWGLAEDLTEPVSDLSFGDSPTTEPRGLSGLPILERIDSRIEREDSLVSALLIDGYD